MLILPALLWAAVQASQVAFGAIGEGWVDDPVPTRTIIDILSENPEFSTLLNLLQTHGLVATINSAFNVTLLAPVNSAFIDTKPEDVTRNQLLYLLVNRTILLSEADDTQIIAPTFYIHNGFGAPVQVSNTNINHGESEIVERDLLGSPQRGIVQGISQLLTVPSELCVEALKRNDVSIFLQLASLGDSCRSLGDNITMFLPSNAAMDVTFADIELLYLFSGAATADRYSMINRHTMDGYIDPQNPPELITMKDGSKWKLEPDSLLLNDTYSPSETYLCASNGIYNVYKSVLGTSVTFTPEKYILALRGYSFVRALHLYGYQNLIDGSNTESQTILVPLLIPQLTRKRQESLEALGDEVNGDGLQLNPLGDNDDILYQFFDNFHFNSTRRLIDTHMPLKSGKYPQRAILFNSESGKHFVNWQQITSKAYQLGNTTIMTVDGKLNPPARLQMAIGPLLTSSYSLDYLEKLDLLQLPVEHSWTLLLPTREAWDRRILLKYYFDAHRDALRSLFNSFIYSTPIYSDSRPTTLSTIDELQVSVGFSKSSDGTLRLQVDDYHYDTDASDLLFDNGVVHCITNLVLPPTLEISAQDLIQSGKRSIFSELLEVAGLEAILEPSSGNYTVIVPSSKALAAANYTVDTPVNELETMLKLHIIENNPTDKLKHGGIVDSLGGEALQFDEASPNIYSISLVSGGGQRVFVTGWGDTNGRLKGGTTVLFIDSLISPKWIQPPFIRPPFRFKSHTLLLIGVVLGLMLTGLIGVAAVYIFIDDKILESQPLLRPATATTRVPVPEDEDEQDEYGAMQRSRPIAATHVAQGREYGQHLDLP